MPNGHQYSSGSLPSMSRTCVRAQDGHSHTWPRLPFSMLHASASAGGASARERPQRWHIGGSEDRSAMAVKPTSSAASQVDRRGAEHEDVVPRTDVGLV